MILYPELIPLKQSIIPQAKATLDAISRMNDIIMDGYEALITSTHDNETVKLMQDLRQSIANATHNITHTLDAVSLIGAKQEERYFAIKNGELQEVSKEEYPPDDDTSIAPEV